MLMEKLAPIFRSIYNCGPIAVARRRSVGRSVCLSVNTCNSATNVRIVFKIGGNIPWVNITRRFFRFCKIFNFEFKKKKFNFKKFKSSFSQNLSNNFFSILTYSFLGMNFMN